MPNVCRLVTLKRIARARRAWFDSEKAEISVVAIVRRQMKSRVVAEARSVGGWTCEEVWTGVAESEGGVLEREERRCEALWERRSKPMKRRRMDMAKPTRTSVRSRLGGREESD